MAAHGARRLAPMAENAFVDRRHRAPRRRPGLRLSRAPCARARRSKLCAPACAARFRVSRTTATFIPISPRRPNLCADGAVIDAVGDALLPGLESGAMTGRRPDWLVVERGDAPLIVSIPHAGDRPARVRAGISSIRGSRARTPIGGSTSSTILSAPSARLLVRTSFRARSSTSIAIRAAPRSIPVRRRRNSVPTTTFDGEPLYRAGHAPDASGNRRAAAALFRSLSRGARRRDRTPAREASSASRCSTPTRFARVIPRLFDGELPVFNLGHEFRRELHPATARGGRRGARRERAKHRRRRALQGRLDHARLRQARRRRRGLAARTRLPRLYARARAPRARQLAAPIDEARRADARDDQARSGGDPGVRGQ